MTSVQGLNARRINRMHAASSLVWNGRMITQRIADVQKAKPAQRQITQQNRFEKQRQLKSLRRFCVR